MRTIRSRRGAALAAAVAALTLVAGCATNAGPDAAGGGWLDGEPSRERSIADAAAGAEVRTSDAATSTAEPGAAPTDPPVRDAQPSAALRAGSVDDNERFEEYLLYRQDALGSGIQVHDVDIRGRKIVSVRNRAGKPVVGATVRLVERDGVIAEAKTHADGRAFLFPRPADATTAQQSGDSRTVVVTKGGVRAEVPVSGDPDVAVTLDVADPAPPALDVMFVIDATGSMSDEIEQLKANVISISDRLAALPGAPDVRFATTVFRDRGDAFVTRTFDFTPDVRAFQGALRAVVADGGGDTPESVNAALHDAIHKPSWRGGETVSLAFLVGDAAPHLNYPDDADYAVEMLEAAKRGIEIEPIASSGLDDQGEFVFRQLAQVTGGRFSFLTYGAAGAPEPGDATTHHVDDYSVLSLDDLVVRLVSEELAPLTRSGQL